MKVSTKIVQTNSFHVSTQIPKYIIALLPALPEIKAIYEFSPNYTAD